MNKVMVFADKSNRKFCVSKSDYNNEVKKYVTSSYKKADTSKVHESNLKAAHIAKSLELEDRMEGHTPSQCTRCFTSRQGLADIAFAAVSHRATRRKFEIF